MGRIAKDGADITVTEVVRLECSKCGVVKITRWPCNDRETDDLVRDHIAQHGGRA